MDATRGDDLVERLLGEASRGRDEKVDELALRQDLGVKLDEERSDARNEGVETCRCKKSEAERDIGKEDEVDEEDEDGPETFLARRRRSQSSAMRRVRNERVCSSPMSIWMPPSPDCVRA